MWKLLAKCAASPKTLSSQAACLVHGDVRLHISPCCATAWKCEMTAKFPAKSLFWHFELVIGGSFPYAAEGQSHFSVGVTALTAQSAAKRLQHWQWQWLTVGKDRTKFVPCFWWLGKWVISCNTVKYGNPFEVWLLSKATVKYEWDALEKLLDRKSVV